MVPYPTVIRRGTLAAGALVVALTVDFVTKWLILNFVMMPPRTIEVAPFFSLTVSFNTGVSFGMFRDTFLEHSLLLAGIKVAIVAGLLIWAVRSEKLAETIGLGLIAGGAVGNVVDRIRRGAVTDFLDFHIGDWHWPTFNVADVMITIGVVLLVARSLWPERSMIPIQARQGREDR